MIDYFLRLTLQFGVKTSVEVGAHEAEFSKRISDSGRCPNILAFEASPLVWTRFKNELGPNIKYLHMAISDHCGFEKFYIQQGKDATYTVNNSILERSIETPAQAIYVSCVSLTDLLPLENPIALWVDAEGANREVLSNSQDFLGQTAIIFIEVEHKSYWKNQWLFNDVLKFLSTRGFLLCRLKEQDSYQSNCIFVNKEYMSQNRLQHISFLIRHFLIPKLLWITLWHSKLETVKLIILKLPFGLKVKRAFHRIKS